MIFHVKVHYINVYSERFTTRVRYECFFND